MLGLYPILMQNNFSLTRNAMRRREHKDRQNFVIRPNTGNEYISYYRAAAVKVIVNINT